MESEKEEREKIFTYFGRLDNQKKKKKLRERWFTEVRLFVVETKVTRYWILSRVY